MEQVAYNFKEIFQDDSALTMLDYQLNSLCTGKRGGYSQRLSFSHIRYRTKVYEIKILLINAQRVRFSRNVDVRLVNELIAKRRHVSF